MPCIRIFKQTVDEAIKVQRALLFRATFEFVVDARSQVSTLACLP
jgi:hypothetical protein